MINARDVSDNSVELYAVKDRHETVNIPEEFTMTEDLQRCCYDVIDTLPKTKMFPLIADILERLYRASDAEYFIYTNVDIGLFPNFYDFVKEKINEGLDAFCINRRDMPKRVDGEIINEKNYQKLFRLKGTGHPGKDCFVFKRSSLKVMDFKNVFIGAPPIGRVLMKQVKKTSINFHWFTEEFVTFHIGSDLVWNNPDNPYWLQNINEGSGIASNN